VGKDSVEKYAVLCTSIISMIEIAFGGGDTDGSILLGMFIDVAGGGLKYLMSFPVQQFLT
jgi:hypothetical protein